MAKFWFDQGILRADIVPNPERSDTEALALSIEKWGFIAEALESDHDFGILTDGGPQTCALCIKYFNRPLACRGCPVMAKTGRPHCTGTPYETFSWARNRLPEQQAYMIQCVRDELDFLESLADDIESPALPEPQSGT